MESTVKSIKNKANIYDIIVEKYTNVDLLIVDEAQFLSEKQIEDLYIISKACDITIICYGLRNNFKMDRLFKAIGILIFIFRNIYYWIYNLDNKDYFNFHEFGKFFNSMMYNYNFYIIGIFFGMINYILQKGYAERDVELEEKIYLFSTTKVLKSIKRKKRRNK